MAEKERIALDVEEVTEGMQDRTKEIVWAIRKIMQGNSIYSKELSKKYQVSAAQLNFLLALHEKGPSPPSKIAKYIMVNSSTITGIIDRLEKKGLVARSRTSADRRIITISLTDRGIELVKHAPPPFQKKIVNGLKKLSPHEIGQIVQALTKLAAMLDVQDLDVT